MIAAVIVLGVVALGLGGYIVWDVLREKKKKATVESAAAEPKERH